MDRQKMKKLMLIAMRCEFIEGGFSLTKKGRGIFSASINRRFHYIRCFFDKKYDNEMRALLTAIDQEYQLNK